ncbi:CrcB family protein [Corynebacterium sp. CCM 9185]|uniref:Fluoride-specific ion channel FluC n=1 Tax=Corynebacterium marambiense TaxID=2765364 RepID=A0ABS0W139_9CORY|nr:CrcB family protein [Corynebacterium marambiense]MBI9001368.1 CrcB family protein [Corynebacterium marambiense]MCK7664106.1 CrcB family protein [Corynebacterium marambiense]MCX7543442.1 CrcB family protein [Corynebacterium marambiense]
MTPISLLLVAVGAAFGGIGRYWCARLLPELWGTLVANTTACFLLGVLASEELSTMHPSLVLMAGAGFSGALSTWSTLAKEIGQLIRNGSWRTATVYCTATTMCGISAVFLGGWTF